MPWRGKQGGGTAVNQRREDASWGPTCSSGGSGSVGNQKMSGRFIVTGRGASWVESEVEREDSEVGGKSENQAPGPNSQP